MITAKSTSLLAASSLTLTLSLKLTFALTLALTACGAPATAPEVGEQTERLVDSTLRIRFAAEVNGAPFSCDRSYPGVGRSAATFSPSDLRMYVHGVELVHADGTAEPAQLVQDGRWQYDQLALLDFEDRTGACINGTPDVRTVVELQPPSAPVAGLRFKVGVPFNLDHANAALAPSPLNLSAMFWGWSAGYKFLRLDGRISGSGPLHVHVGSVGCVADASGGIVSCAAPNVAQIELPAFDPALDTVAFDIGTLRSGSTFGADAATSCMGQPSEPACRPVFERLGLGVDGAPVPGQVVFHAAR